MAYQLNHLSELEAESIYVFREVAAQFSNPVILFSGGKDSILMVHLAIKAFYPAPIPFELLHVDTGHNFMETLSFRDDLIEKHNLRLNVASVQKAIDQGYVQEEKGINASRIYLQSQVLLDAIEENNYDVAIGGGRRDEEKARAKERFFSHRNDFGQWNPKNQRPELWNLFNGRMNSGEHFRVFPLSNWTELDVWQYLNREEIQLPNLYFSHQRRVLNRKGVILAESPFIETRPDEEIHEMQVRCRTIGDVTCTGLWPSKASSIDDIIEEISTTRIAERGSRADDKRSESSMEDRKKEGYF